MRRAAGRRNGRSEPKFEGLSVGIGLHDDDVVWRDQVQSRANAFVEQIRIDVLRPEVRNPQFQCCTLRADRLDIRGRGSDLTIEAQPSLKAAVALDQVIGKISSQRDPDNRAKDKMGAPPQCT